MPFPGGGAKLRRWATLRDELGQQPVGLRLPGQQHDAPKASLRLRPGGRRHTGPMATAAATTISRTGPAIKAALAEYGADGEADQFVGELQDALTHATATLDLSETETLLDRWHALATMAVNPLSQAEQAQLARARSGDMTGLRAQTETGDWITL